MRRARESAHGSVMAAMAGMALERMTACAEQARNLRDFSRGTSTTPRTRATARMLARREKAQVPLYRRVAAAFSFLG